MALYTIRDNLTAGTYGLPKEFIDDVLLVFSNAKTYNEQKSRVSLIIIIITNDYCYA